MSSRTSGISSQRSSLPRSDASRALIDAIEQVAHAAHRADLDAVGLELAAHPVHADLDRVAAHLVAEAEQLVDDLLLADDAALAREQKLRQRELARGEIDGQVVVEEPPRGDVEAQPPVRHVLIGVEAAATDERAHPRLELGQV